MRRGQVNVEDVPAPLIEPGHILVEVAYSLISPGTEMNSVEYSGRSLVERVLDQPDKALKVIEYLREQGIKKTVTRVRGQIDTGRPLGYSCSGIVLQTGAGVEDIHPGDRVACAGAEIANHAEIVLVPRNLLIKIPTECDLRSAASATLGAIAMQGVRRADPRLGEIIAVIGLGLVGQLTVQLLNAGGCRVIGFDLDPRRVELARQLGAEASFVSTEINSVTEIRHRTNGHGADAVIITAASQSNTIVQQAMEMTRRKGRVVVVGEVGLDLKRSPFYEKELDFLISCSYGPGRYDASYEEQGLDYPYEYVRWTENRNMAEYLRLICDGKVQIDTILEQEYDVAEASEAYQALQNANTKPLGILLRYPLNGEATQANKLSTRVQLHRRPVSNKINIAVIGAGAFAKSMHLPNLQQLNNLFHIRSIVSSTGSNAKATAQQFNADYASTNYSDVLNDPDVDAVLIATRHHLHAQQAIAAAKAGKAIFLEKPMALNQAELDELVAVLDETQVPFMMGFNRRFSPAVRRAKEIIGERQTPLMMYYRVNAGYIPPDNWVHSAEGGGRIIGEACHMLDVFQYLVGNAKPSVIASVPIVSEVEHIAPSENAVITVRYDDGSIGNLLYSSLGSADFPKEYIEIFMGNTTLVVNDFRELNIYGNSSKSWKSSIQDKGHLTELEAFANYLLNNTSSPVPLEHSISTTKVSFSAQNVA